MFNLIVSLKDPATNYLLNYKTAQSVKTAREQIWDRIKKDEMTITLKDDFGQQFDVMAYNISCTLIQDNQERCSAETEKNIDQARHNAEFMTRRNGDMELMRLFPANQFAAGGRA